MSIRRASLAAVIVASVAAGASGCAFVTPVATERSYNASDGIVISVGDVKLDNIALVADDQGEGGRLIGQVSTTSDTARDVTLTIEGQDPLHWTVDAHTPIDLEQTDTVLADLGAQPGATLTATATAAGQSESDKTIPIIGGDLAEYSTLVPSAPASASASAESEGFGATAEPGASTLARTSATPAA